MDEKEIKNLLSDPLMDPLMKRIAENYLRVHADRNNLAEMLAGYHKQYNEMYTILVALVRQLGDRFTLEKKFMPQFDVAQYKVRWEDAPEADALLLEVKHFTD